MLMKAIARGFASNENRDVASKDIDTNFVRTIVNNAQ